MTSAQISDREKGRVLVTGASRGIGKAIALELAHAGFDIAVHYVRDQQGAEDSAAAIQAAGCSAVVLQFDVCDRNRTKQVIDSDVSRHGAYYGVVCNAGMSADAVFPGMTEEQWDQVIGTNLDAFYNVLNPVVLPMIRRRKPGRIVTISSVAGLMGNRGQVNYSAAKAGIIGASKALALELASRHITVNCVVPGIIASDMTKDLVLDELLAMIPMGRPGSAEEVAAAVGFLMSARASYITRQVVAVNGGMV
jgi:3-oxoacyl-[acyl-carrier protein] reductase